MTFSQTQTLVKKLLKNYESRGQTFDYEHFLTHLKHQLGERGNHVIGTWNKNLQVGGSLYKEFTVKALHLVEKSIDGYGNESYFERNHYIIQIFKIPLREKCTLFNLMKVACYCALFLFHARSKDYPPRILANFKEQQINSMEMLVMNYDEDCLLQEDDVRELVSSAAKALRC